MTNKTTRIVTELHRICANCKPPIIKMERLPDLKDIYICPKCSRFEYIVPEQRIEEDEDTTLYNEENDGE